MSFFDSLARFARLPDGRLDEGWDGGPLGANVRTPLYLALLDEQVQAARVPPRTVAAHLHAQAQAALGSLRGLLAGLPDSALDERAGEEWTLREILAHVLLTERRYLDHTAYALSRAGDEPVYRQIDVRLATADTSGGAGEWVARLENARRLSFDALQPEGESLRRPTRWAGIDVDVEFRLARFAGHVQEHTIQAEKLLGALGRRPSEAHRIVRLISSARGAHELLSTASDLRRLDAAHAERAAGVSR